MIQGVLYANVSDTTSTISQFSPVLTSLKSSKKPFKKGKIIGYWHSRHWLSTVSHGQFSSSVMQAITDEVFDTMETVIHKVRALLPRHFPQAISDAVFEGMHRVKG